MECAVSWKGNGSANGAGIYELAQAEHLSWKISMGLASGDARDFDLWLSNFWRDGEPSAEFQEENLAAVVKRSAAEEKRLRPSAELRMRHELFDDLRRRLDEIGHATDAQTRKAAKLHGHLGNR